MKVIQNMRWRIYHFIRRYLKRYPYEFKPVEIPPKCRLIQAEYFVNDVRSDGKAEIVLYAVPREFDLLTDESRDLLARKGYSFHNMTLQAQVSAGQGENVIIRFAKQARDD